MGDSGELLQVISDFAQVTVSYAVVLAAVGTITMALLELIKSVVDWRMRFHRKRLRKWILADKHKGAFEQLLLLASGAAESKKVSKFKRIAGWLWTGELRHSDVVFDQPVEKMMGQIQAAANVALEFPHLYEPLYRFLATPPHIAGAPEAKDHPDDVKTWLKYAKKAADGKFLSAEQLDKKGMEKAGREQRDEQVEANQARARIANLVARKLDAFQNETFYLWEERNQRYAFLISSIFLGWLLVFAQGGPCMPWYTGYPVAAFGGLLAPFAKDVVTALSGLASKKAG